MQITAWLSRLTDFVNLGKFLVDAGPGFILAIALAVLVASVSDVPLLPIVFEEEQSEEQGDARRELSRFDRKLRALNGKIEKQQDATGRIEAEKASADARVQQNLKGLQVKEAEEDELRKQQQALIGGGRMGGTALAGRLREAQGVATKLRGERAQLLAAQASLANQLEASDSKLEALLARRERMESQIVTSLSDLVTLLLNHLIGLVLIGWILGTLVGPVNRFVFLKSGLLPRLDQIPPISWLIRLLTWKKEATESPDERRQKEIKSEIDARLAYAARSAGRELTDEEKARITQEVSTLWADIRLELANHPPSFFIGRGVISKDEWDGMVTSYYRFAEAAVNLVVPVLLLCLVLAFLQTEAWAAWTLGGSGTVLALLFIATGQRGNSYYEGRMDEYIEGRLWHVAAESRKTEMAKDLEQAVKEVIEQLKKVAESLESR
jgi:hypothetical protein